MRLPYFLTEVRPGYMSYAKPEFTPQKLNWSGTIIRTLLADDSSSADLTKKDLSLTFDILDNCRASHSYPLNTFYSTLKRRAHKVSSAALVSQLFILFFILNSLWSLRTPLTILWSANLEIYSMNGFV